MVIGDHRTKIMFKSKQSGGDTRIPEVSDKTIYERLAHISESTHNCPLIAVDLDDVLCQTSKCAADWHNERYKTNMQLGDFYYSMWYKNPGWGTVSVTLAKIKEFYDTDQLCLAAPVPGSLDGLNVLREMGYGLVIVTARSMASELDSTMAWLDQHFRGVFTQVIFSGQDRESLTCGEVCEYIGTRLGKLQICETIKSTLLIDDLLETALTFGREADRPILLFGDYEWNKRIDTGDQWSFDEKLALEGGRKWWEGEVVRLSDQDRIWRVSSWNEVIQWLKSESRACAL
ncbi:hypothetical protein BC834DRAFT_225013 [Gloeopeniophorella convolvens]|nr:hypothetical protein BC834DRAFT_225013 [Gloeopeniophorella convolvens]